MDSGRRTIPWYSSRGRCLSWVVKCPEDSSLSVMDLTSSDAVAVREEVVYEGCVTRTSMFFDSKAPRRLC
jgi:hypothetical protein